MAKLGGGKVFWGGRGGFVGIERILSFDNFEVT